MGREIKLRFVFKHYKTNKIKFHFCTLDDLLEGPLDENDDHLAMDLQGDGYDLIGEDQCTGLKDKHGKDVYEEDLFERNGHIGRVVYGCGCYSVIFDDSKVINLLIDSKWDWFLEENEIIGNSWEKREE